MTFRFTADDFQGDPEDQNQQEDPALAVEDEVDGSEDEEQEEQGVETPDPLDMVFDGDNVPASLRGKKAREVLSNFETLQNFAQNLLQQQRQQSHATPAAPAEPEVEFTEEDLLGTDPAVFQKKLETFFQKQTQPLLVDYYSGQSEMQYRTAQQNPKFKYFKDFEDEILSMARQLPVNQTALASTWEGLYAIVVQRHLDTILQKEQAARSRKPATPPVTERGTAPQRKPKSGAASLTAQEKSVADALGISHEDYARYVPKKES
jgi:hypothetical protein